MPAGIAATTWSVGGADRIDLFWRDDVFAMSHVGGDGSKWSSNRIGPLKFVVPEWPDALGGIFTTVPAAVWTFARLVHHLPQPVPTPGPHPPASTARAEGEGSVHPAAATAEAPGAGVIHPPIP